jgi:hypothetical protein
MSTEEDLALTRRVLEKQQAWYQVIHETGQLEKFDTLDAHLAWLSTLPKLPPSVHEQEIWARQRRVEAGFGTDAHLVLEHKLVAVDAGGHLCTCGHRFSDWLEHLGDVALAAMRAPKARKRYPFTERQLQIAAAAIEKRSAA